MSADRVGAVRPEVHAMPRAARYELHGGIKLDTMENPYTWPDEMRRAWAERMHRVDVNRYPDASATAARNALRTAFGVPADLDIVVGNGSDELIQLAVMATGGPGRPVMSPAPCFPVYAMAARITGSPFVGVPLGPDFSLDVPAMLEALRRERPSCLFIAWPNNPTGNLFEESGVVELIESAPDTLVVVDEAYQVFAERSFAPRILEFPNVVVMRTLSKLGLAGIRLGYLLGRKEWTEVFEKVRMPFNVSVLTQEATVFALEHMEVFEGQAQRILAERERVRQQLARIDHVEVFPSSANFLLLRVPRAGAVFEGLRARDIHVKLFDGAHPLLAGCLRTAIGTREENDALLDALSELLR